MQDSIWGLSPGEYIITVQEQLTPCVSVDTFSITEPDLLVRIFQSFLIIMGIQ